MTTEQHLLFLGATLLTVMAPALTLPTLGAWGLMWWLGRAVDAAPNAAGDGAGCGGTMLLIVIVGGAALAIVFVFGAMLEGRI